MTFRIPPKYSPQVSPMAISALALLLFLGIGCAGRKKNYSEVEKRDYYSVNKSSVAFLTETFRRDRRTRKESFRQNYDWSALRRENARIQKESVKFVGGALSWGELKNAKQAWTVGLPRELKGPDDFWASVRFGFLDSDR